jgi:hypothetical protein
MIALGTSQALDLQIDGQFVPVPTTEIAVQPSRDQAALGKQREDARYDGRVCDGLNGKTGGHIRIGLGFRKKGGKSV